MSQQTLQNIVLTQLHGGIALVTRGATAELTEKLNISQPEADIIVLQALFNQLDAQADLPTMLIGPVLDAIRTSVENEHAEELAEDELATMVEETNTIRARLQEPES